MNKRGQVTLFVIIALVIVIAVLLFVFLRGGFNTSINDSDLNKVRAYVVGCFRDKTKEGTLYISKQGGYNSLPENSINFLGEKTAYYLKNNLTLIPNINIVEEELSSWLDNSSRDCLRMPEYALTNDKCKSTVNMKDLIEITFDCPITIKNGSSS